MNNTMYLVFAIAVVAIVTFSLRALPFAIFGTRPLPKTIKYLGSVLPPAIMTILVVYCLKGTRLLSFPFGIPEIVASLLVVVLQVTRKNMYLSIVAGTICYMMLIRVLV